MVTGVVGIDEVGRGCWAGPLVAGAVLLAEPIPGLKDSKKLSKTQREKLDAEIRVQAIAWGLGWVSPTEVDKLGLTTAVKRAMERALAALREQLVDQSLIAEIIIDGNYQYLPDEPLAQTLIKADDSVPAASAASIIAKVARDRYMAEQDIVFPGYGFGTHVGYGTAVHIAALENQGICALHRLSYKPIAAFAERA